MTPEQRQQAMTAFLECRQAERALGGLREMIRRCKPGSATFKDYQARIEKFERQIVDTSDQFHNVLIMAVTP